MLLGGAIMYGFTHSPNKNTPASVSRGDPVPLGIVSGKASGIKICQVKYVELLSMNSSIVQSYFQEHVAM